MIIHVFVVDALPSNADKRQIIRDAVISSTHSVVWKTIRAAHNLGELLHACEGMMSMDVICDIAGRLPPEVVTAYEERARRSGGWFPKLIVINQGNPTRRWPTQEELDAAERQANAYIEGVRKKTQPSVGPHPGRRSR